MELVWSLKFDSWDLKLPCVGSEHFQDASETDYAFEMVFFVHHGEGSKPVLREGIHHILLVFVRFHAYDPG